MALPLDVEATWHDSTASYDGGELRRADAAAFGGAGLALGIHGGVVRHGDTSLAVTVDGADVITVQPGAVAIPGNAVSGTGCYRSAVQTAVTGSLTARHATNARIDLVVFRAMDTDVVPAHAARTGRVEIIAGTPSGSPGVPTFPTMAVELARISVPATGGGTATVDSTFRTYAFAVGGEMVVPSLARLPASAAAYQIARSLATGVRYKWNGTAWTATDPVSANVDGGSTNASGYITLPLNLPFTPTHVSVNARNSTYNASVDDANTNATSARVYFRLMTTGAVVASTAIGQIQWTAHP